MFDKGAPTLTLAFNFKTKKNIGQSTRGVCRQIVCAANSSYCFSKKVPVTPYLENETRPPTNLYTAEAPHTATFLSVDKISCPEASGETYNIVFDHGGFLPHWEGQVFGIMPPVS